MFSKSKRFENKPVGCGADATYNVIKSEVRAVGGVIPKVERFKSFKSDKSDTESVTSDKSSQVFRTPKTIRRNILNSANKKLTTTKSCSNIKCDRSQPFIDDIVKTKEVEIRNKDATILEYEQQISEMKNKISDLTDNISLLQENTKSLQDELLTKSSIKSPDRKLNELKENLALVKSHHALALEANESIRHEYKMEIDALKCKHDEEMQSIINHYKSEMEDVNKNHQTDVQGMTADFADKIKNIEDDYISQIKMLEENSVEKIKICEIQYEERLQELKTYTDSVLCQEKQKWQCELNKCQETTENEIMKFEMQIQDLKGQLDVSSKNVKDLSNHVSNLQKTIDSKENQLDEAYCKIQLAENLSNNQRSEYLKEIEILNNELRNVNHEKNKFSLTLETTRQTMEALSMRLRNSDEDVEALKDELEKSREELQEFKVEYNQLLLSIVGSKSALDKSHEDVLEKNKELSGCLFRMEADFVDRIETMKKEFSNEIDHLKSNTMILVNDLEEKNMNEHIKYLEVKEKCDEAYSIIDECKNIMFNAECQLETKDQEINELETENNRLTGTLAAVEQEKNESQSLLREFNILLSCKDQKIHDYVETIADSKQRINDLEDQVKKVSELLEITEFIMKEKENENFKLHDENVKLNGIKEKLDSQILELNSQLDEYEALSNDLMMKHAYEKDVLHEDIKKLNCQLTSKDDHISDLQHKISEYETQSNEYEMHSKSCNLKAMESMNAKLEKDLEEMTVKYTDLLGHQNNKQKIKHVIDLKTQNYTLKDENDKLQHTIQKQAAQIEKLKKEIECNRIKSPVRKPMLSISTPKGKENSPMGKSPKVLASPLAERQLTPLKDLNR